MFSNSTLQSSSSIINSLQFMSPISRAQPVPTPLHIWQMKSSMWSQQLVSRRDSAPDCFFFLLLPHRYAAQWLAVAVAPIMNSLLHLNTEYFHYISFIGIMRAEGKLTAGLCNSMASTALFSTGLCLGACLSVWSSCVGLDTGVQSQMVASSNGVSTPGWCLHQLCLLLVKALMYRAATPRNVEALPRTVSPWLQSVSLLWQCWPQKPMHANRLKMTEVHFEAIMSCWSPTQRSRSKTKSNLRHRRASWPCKSESNPLNTLYGGH